MSVAKSLKSSTLNLQQQEKVVSASIPVASIKVVNPQVPADQVVVQKSIAKNVDVEEIRAGFLGLSSQFWIIIMVLVGFIILVIVFFSLKRWWLQRNELSRKQHRLKVREEQGKSLVIVPPYHNSSVAQDQSQEQQPQIDFKPDIQPGYIYPKPSHGSKLDEPQVSTQVVAEAETKEEEKKEQEQEITKIKKVSFSEPVSSFEKDDSIGNSTNNTNHTTNDTTIDNVFEHLDENDVKMMLVGMESENKSLEEPAPKITNDEQAQLLLPTEQNLDQIIEIVTNSVNNIATIPVTPTSEPNTDLDSKKDLEEPKQESTENVINL